MKRFIVFCTVAVLLFTPAAAFGDTEVQSTGDTTQAADTSTPNDISSADEDVVSNSDGTDETTGPDTDTEPASSGPKNHPVTNLKAVSKNFRQITLSWNCDSKYTGNYTIYRVSGNKSYYVGKTYAKSYKISGLKAGTKYTYRVKSDVLSNTVSATVITQKTASMTMVKSGSSRWDIRIAAKQKLYDYDTIQGACSYKEYAYMALYNRKKERIKIAKVNLKTMKVVKVSKPLKSRCHGNTLTYNPRTKKIIAVCGKGAKKSIVFVKASTLKQTSKKTFKIKKSLIKTKYTGVAGVSYNTKYNKYILKVRGSSNRIVRYSSSWKSKKYIPITGNRSYLLPQGTYTKDSYMYDVQSFKGKHKYNLVTIRTINGTFIGRLVVPSGTSGRLFELENIFYDDVTKTWYASFYRANVRKQGDTHRENYLYKINNMWS